MTNNDRYRTPQKGGADWHVPLNENFQKLAVDVEFRDDEENLETYEPTAGSKFYAVDTGSVYIGDGDNWNRVPASGSSPTFDRATVNEVQNSTGQAAIQTAWDGLVVPTSTNLGASDAINTEATDTPIQDAIDKIGTETGGTI